MSFLACVALTAVLAATDVTSDAERRHTLLEYVEGREDLRPAERERWLKQIKRTFGGKALTDGTDEGITAAKSVLSGALFFGVDAEVAVRGAYAAYHDVARWVPPPVAINYQLLSFRGRKPRFSAREMAYDFPNHFDPEIAPDLASWWASLLAAGRIPQSEERAVRDALAATRAMMRPHYLERLWQAVAREAAGAPREEIARMTHELEEEFAGVGGEAAHRASLYARYTALARELGRPVRDRPKPSVQPETPPAARPETTTPKPRTPAREIVPWTAPIPAPSGFRALLGKTVAQWLGTPYLFGGTSRDGVDCSAFSRATMRATLGIDIPRNARGQARIGSPVTRDALRAGDLVFFDTLERGHITHVGVYLGDGHFAHASSSRGVVRDALGQRYYQRAYRTSRRLLE